MEHVGVNIKVESTTSEATVSPQVQICQVEFQLHINSISTPFVAFLSYHTVCVTHRAAVYNSSST